MNLTASWKGFWQVLEDDRQFRSLGLPQGWYVWFHYRGRLEYRLRRPFQVDLIQAQMLDRSVAFPLSFPYTGMAKGILLDQEYTLRNRLPFQPKRVLDLGANIGLGALSLYCQFPTAEFVCVEPDPRNHPLLQQTLTLNQISAHVIDCAVGPTPGVLNLRFGTDPTCSALETSPMHELEQTVPITVKTVPEILNQVGWDAVDLLKIDIEGTEDDLLAQHNQWLHRVGAIVLEIHPNTTPERIQSYIEPFGFHLQRHSHGREPVYLATRRHGTAP